jgi:hypothetical protein
MGHVVYTSITRADPSTLLVAKDHLRTEQALLASGPASPSWATIYTRKAR